MPTQTTQTLGVAFTAALDAGVPLTTELAERCWRYGSSSPDLRAKIAACPDLPDTLRARVAADTTAKVRTAYLRRADLSSEEFFALLEGEQRPSLLALAAESPDTPADVLERLGASDSAVVAKALFGNERAPHAARRSALKVLFAFAMALPEGARDFVLSDRDLWAEYLEVAPAAELQPIVERSTRSREELAALIERLPQLSVDDWATFHLAEMLVEHQTLDEDLHERLCTVLKELGTTRLHTTATSLATLVSAPSFTEVAQRAQTTSDPDELAELVKLANPGARWVAVVVSLNPASSIETTLAAIAVSHNATAVLKRRCNDVALARALIESPKHTIYRAPLEAPLEVLKALVADRATAECFNGPLEDLVKAGRFDASLIAELDTATAFTVLKNQNRHQVAGAVVRWMLDALADVEPEIVDGLLKDYKGPLGRFVELCRALADR